MRRQHDDTADKIAALAGLSATSEDVGNIRETIDAVKDEDTALSDVLMARADSHCTSK